MATNAYSMTFHGDVFDFVNPKPEMFSMETIAHVMFKIPRWNGHLADDFPWTLGHHSLLVHDLLQKYRPEQAEFGPEALCHDGSEVLTGDPPGPFKRLLGEAYKVHERKYDSCMAEQFGLYYPWPRVIKEMDILSQDIEGSMGLRPCPLRDEHILSPGFVLTDEHKVLVHDVMQKDANDFLNTLKSELTVRWGNTLQMGKPSSEEPAPARSPAELQSA